MNRPRIQPTKTAGITASPRQWYRVQRGGKTGGVDDAGVRLILKWLTAPAHQGNQRYQAVKGLPQGSLVVPILANLYLTGFDANLEATSLIRGVMACLTRMNRTDRVGCSQPSSSFTMRPSAARSFPVVFEDGWLRVPTFGGLVTKSSGLVVVRHKKRTIFECLFDEVLCLTIEAEGDALPTAVIHECAKRGTRLVAWASLMVKQTWRLPRAPVNP